MTQPAHRIGDVDLLLLDERGEPLAERDVEVRQLRHTFGFGCTGFELIDEALGGSVQPGLADDWFGLFDTATLPFYWGEYEPERGDVRNERIETAAKWFAERGVRLKGHPLVWHTVKPTWLDALPTEEVERAVLDRVTTEVARFRGLIGAWDVVNEAVIMPVFDNEPDGVAGAVPRLARQRGRLRLIRESFSRAREADPGAVLLLNDFDLSTGFECLIEGALESGAPIDAIGLQTHMHQGFRGETELVAIADRFARFGLPLHFTETTLVSGDLMPSEIVDLNDYHPAAWPSTAEGEHRQAEELDRHYRALVGHPAVASITYWGLSDAGAWLGAPAGLTRADGTRKPAYDVLRDLVRRQWWFEPATLRSSAEGRVRVRGFLGDYAVEGAGTNARFSITVAGPAEATVLLERD